MKIEIQTSPMPKMRQRKSRRSERMVHIIAAVQKMPAPSWFVVPGTECAPGDEKAVRSNAVFCGAVNKQLKLEAKRGNRWAIGVAAGTRDEDRAVIVRKTAEVGRSKAAGGGT